MHNRTYQGVGQFYQQNKQLGQQYQVQAQAQAANQAMQLQLLQQQFKPSNAAVSNPVSNGPTPKADSKLNEDQNMNKNISESTNSQLPNSAIKTSDSLPSTPMNVKNEPITPGSNKPSIKSRLSLEPSGSPNFSKTSSASDERQIETTKSPGLSSNSTHGNEKDFNQSNGNIGKSSQSNPGSFDKEQELHSRTEGFNSTDGNATSYQHGNRGRNQDNQYFNEQKRDYAKHPTQGNAYSQDNYNRESDQNVQNLANKRNANDIPPLMQSRNYDRGLNSQSRRPDNQRGNDHNQGYRGYDNRRSNYNDTFDRAAIKEEAPFIKTEPGWNENANRNQGYQQRNERGHRQGGQWDQGGYSKMNSISQRLYYGVDKLKERINTTLSGPQHDLPPLEMAEKKFNANSRLFIGNLPKNTSQEELDTLFGKYGEIGQTYVNKEASYAFITFDFKANAAKAQAEMDEFPIKNRSMKVRFATISEGIKVKNLTPYVSNELLELAFGPFGQVDTCRITIDERGLSKGEGIIIFRDKRSATLALKKCQEECYFLSGAMRPVVVQQLEYQEDLQRGLTEASLPRNDEYHQERSVGPHFADLSSFEFEFGLQWKKLFNAYEEKKKILERDFMLEIERMEKKMVLAKVECETDKLRRELAAREADAAHLRRHFGEALETPVAPPSRPIDPYNEPPYDQYQTAGRHPQDYDRTIDAQQYARSYPRDAYDRPYDKGTDPQGRDTAARDLRVQEAGLREMGGRDYPTRDIAARDLPVRDMEARDLPARDMGRDVPFKDSMAGRDQPAKDVNVGGRDLGRDTQGMDMRNQPRNHPTQVLPHNDLMDRNNSPYPRDAYGSQGAYGGAEGKDEYNKLPVKRPRY